jgi:hypothetical protein
MPVDIRPLTPDFWPDFEDLFGKQGACYGCWCTYFRLPPAARKANDSQQKKAIIRERIETGPPPGLLAFEDGQAVGWMQIGPRADVPEWNNKGRGSAPADPDDASGRVGNLMLLPARQGARQRPDPRARRGRTGFCQGKSRAIRRSLPDRPVEGLAFCRPVRRVDAGVRKGRILKAR